MSDLAEMLASAKAQGYKEGRTDAIDEMKQWLYKHKDANYSTILLFLDELEQLKENK